MNHLFALAGCILSVSCLADIETSEAVEEAVDGVCNCSLLPDTPCSDPVCIDGVCVLQHTPDGELAEVYQPHGDCHSYVCIGLAVVKVFEPHDKPWLPDPCLTSICTKKGVVWVERDGCPP